VHGHRVRPLGVEHFGQTGTIGDVYRHYGIDADANVAAVVGRFDKTRLLACDMSAVQLMGSVHPASR